MHSVDIFIDYKFDIFSNVNFFILFSPQVRLQSIGWRCRVCELLFLCCYARNDISNISLESISFVVDRYSRLENYCPTYSDFGFNYYSIHHV